MWIFIWRPLLVLLGAGGLAAATLVAALVRDNPYANIVMGWVLLVLAFQAAVSIGLIIYGVWRPIHRWAEERAARARSV